MRLDHLPRHLNSPLIIVLGHIDDALDRGISADV
jgi:hypothetical protein